LFILFSKKLYNCKYSIIWDWFILKKLLKKIYLGTWWFRCILQYFVVYLVCNWIFELIYNIWRIWLQQPKFQKVNFIQPSIIELPLDDIWTSKCTQSSLVTLPLGTNRLLNAHLHVFTSLWKLSNQMCRLDKFSKYTIY